MLAVGTHYRKEMLASPDKGIIPNERECILPYIKKAKE
jgi:hypothetical protein